jgi:hypothetical protein
LLKPNPLFLTLSSQHDLGGILGAAHPRPAQSGGSAVKTFHFLDINGAVRNSRNHRKGFCVKAWKGSVFSRKMGLFFFEVLKKFLKLPYFVIAKELHNQEHRVVD